MLQVPQSTHNMFPCKKKKNIIPFFGYRKPLIQSYEYSFSNQEIRRMVYHVRLLVVFK